MLGKSNSFLVVGLCAGVLAATLGFAMMRGASGAVAGEAPARVLKLAHSLDEKHPVHLAMLYMAGVLDQKSQGQLRLQIYANGSLCGEAESIEQMQQGVLDLAKTSTAPLESFVPEMAVLGVPYVFTSDDQYWRVLDGEVGQELLDAGQGVGLKGLCFYDAGARSFYTVKRPILKPEDLEGLKIRVQQSKTAIAMVDALGGSPTPIEWGELYSALQTSTVDGAENNLPSYFSNRHFEVCRHFSLSRHTRVPDVLLCSGDTWNSLSAEEQGWLQQAADESARMQRKLWELETERVLGVLAAEGVSVHEPDLAPFAEKVKGLHQSYDGAPIGDLLRRIAEE